ncbi:YfiT family bacillithiol transferase [Chryseolinea lacunae]|uniref:Metal-dependent hydrolase n=1 Tax=Chryseolinea lacunae TaxID=2801331 RepID=A0ABS1L002_9BACT|nr:putative metal-dependent hydrolase [Chryseolinea lacunae]MBL0744964.1 putative metal-dependent hydrolase [Chryseolinea lacunae]
MNSDDQLRYPVGKFAAKESYTAAELHDLIRQIENLPAEVEKVVNNYNDKQLDTPYREGGWTARQVVHHMADSHMNAFIRFKWTLTEDTPTIKAYNEKAWATTPETSLDPVISITLLKALHTKWTALLSLLTPEDLTKSFLHPDTQKYVRLDRLIALYAWHGAHHLGHLKIVANLS